MNNYYNINNVETENNAELTKDFSYTLDTNYSKDKPSVHKYNEFVNFAADLRQFIETNKIETWKLTTITSKFGKLEPITDKPLAALDNLLHNKRINWTDEILEIKMQQEQAVWTLLANYKKNDKKSRVQILFDFDYGNITDEEFRSGLTLTYTITYTDPNPGTIEITDKVIEDRSIDLDFNAENLDSFKNNLVPTHASIGLQKKHYIVKPEWLIFKNAIQIENGQEATDELLKGAYGAGRYILRVTVEANKLGNENHIYGEVGFVMILNFKYADLAHQNGSYHELSKPISSYTNLLSEFTKSINEQLYSINNAFYFIKDSGKKSLKISDFYDTDTNKEFETSDIINEIESGNTKTIYTFISPTEYGKQMGILNSAKVNIIFVKK